MLNLTIRLVLKENAEDFTGMNVTECSAMISKVEQIWKY
jgi:hypothetical protein